MDALNTEAAARRLGLATKTLENWRVLGCGPKFIRAGRRVVYDPADIEQWKAKNRLSSTSERVAA